MTTYSALCEAVRDGLNAAPKGTDPNPVFTPDFTAVKRLLPNWSLEELATLRVTVAPQGRSLELVSRASEEDAIQIAVGVQQQIDLTDESASDGLVAFVDQVIDFISRSAFLGYQWTQTTNDPMYSVKHLDENGVFSSFVVATFQGMRS